MTAEQYPPYIPDSLRTAHFLAVWHEYEKHRKEKRAKLTPTAIRRLMLRLEPLGPEEATRWLDYSISQGWTGVFPPPISARDYAPVSSRANKRRPADGISQEWLQIQEELIREAQPNLTDEQVRATLEKHAAAHRRHLQVD